MATTGTADSGARGGGSERLWHCVAAALVWASPHLFSRGEVHQVGPLGFVALVGCGSLSLFLLVLAFERRETAESVGRQRRILGLGFGLALAPWSALAYALMTATHHRPLGAVTFAFGALALGAAGVSIASWLVRRSADDAPLGRQLLAAAIGTAALAAVALSGLSVRASLEHPGAGWVALDVAVGAALTAAVLTFPVGRLAVTPRRTALGGCIALWAVTLWLMNSAPDVRATVKSVPVIAGVVGLAMR